MTTNLTQASSQWAQRPADERFWTLEEMHAETKRYAEQSSEVAAKTKELTVYGTDGEMTVATPDGTTALLNHWSFEQLSYAAGTPVNFMRKLPTHLAAACMNDRLQANVPAKQETKLLIQNDGRLTCRAFTSPEYTRIWNHNVIEKLLPLSEKGWRAPPARPANDDPRARVATEADVLESSKFNGAAGIQVKVGDMIAPAGLYASDHDMFVFMVNEQARVDDGTDGGLSRGFFVSNTEVGEQALRITKFMYRHVCGNHIVWGASNVSEIKIPHKGTGDAAYAEWLISDLSKYLEASVADEINRIENAKKMLLADTEEAVKERLYTMKDMILGKKQIDQVYIYAKREADLRTSVDPRSIWGIVNGLTAYSQMNVFADKRAKMDRLAGQILSMAF